MILIALFIGIRAPVSVGSVKGAKASFFSTEAVRRSIDKRTHFALSRFGAFVRRSARFRIRKRKGGQGVRDRLGRFTAAGSLVASRPGQSPTNRSGLLREMIFFAYDRQRKTVVIGPTQLDGPIKRLHVPEVLEEGGIVTGVRILPRPYMRPAFAENLPKVLPLLKGAA